MNSNSLIVIASIVSMMCCAVGAEDPPTEWPHWRGPLDTGEAPLGDPPVRWSKERNVRWKRAIPGAGHATPIVWREHVFILTAVPAGRRGTEDEIAKILDANQDQLTTPPSSYIQFLVLDIDRDSGEIRWQREANELLSHEGIHQTNTFASASPITDGRHVYASFGSRGIFCYDFDGELQWSRQLGSMKTRRGWGEGASPALLPGKLLYVVWDQERDSYLYALDVETGETRWQVARDEPTSWSTPLIVNFSGGAQVIVSATNRIRSYEALTGKLIWECGGLTTNVIPCPVATQDAVICMSWYRQASAVAIPLDSRGDVTDSPKLRWRYDKTAPYCPSPLLTANRVYFFHFNTSLLTGLNAQSGQPVLKPRRLSGIGQNIYASPVAAAGRMYIVDRDGNTMVASLADGFEKLAVNQIGESVDASLAIVGKQLFLRGAENLYCLEER